ncbi:MAG: hypothetical protein QT02_C0005G0022 [archaeon GW2011_AR9]|nr:MAG: hypothetical protein QT02_C0005G0022 [archaeon GW2011_AR9]MBS3120640.1 hypothetical protein [Candidatus Woesearchaeota archaeon]HIG93685.1 hypothetical protein [Candidatus Woesearchaeota archaeon]
MNMNQKKPLTIEERIRLADEGLDIFGKDCRIFPPPIMVDKEKQPTEYRGSFDEKAYKREDKGE